MKYLKVVFNIERIVYLVLISVLISCNENTVSVAEQPILSDYTVGEKWTWKYKGVTTEGEVRSEGEDTREIVNMNGGLGMVIEKDTIPVSDIVKPEESETPRYKWPLEVGKTWRYEKNWTSQDGTTGTQSQDAKVLSYKEETVDAGTFMAYTIEYKGTVSNSRGYNAQTDEVWLYAPELKNFIKMTQTQDGFLYNEELIKYVYPNKK
ncbi:MULTISPECIES: hypothetical protein [Winogradskyella]|jgi:hypothetical protein|uniref:Lipocalin-like domain-containing protein n=2 Tax=Winogradskyella TaxID=286104 RepID=A0ABT7ZUV8_9FLAO|nr:MULTISPECIES: hypothetical protein [Winogradskyella]MBC3844939.1 hypothetical protein [Winogradskyella echinorum]MBC5749287.1 hypothetical protein [Winogradskyella echinorum]MDN3492760.1 hypothetical protein [Winogradskyella bathintestinalis]